MKGIHRSALTPLILVAAFIFLHSPGTPAADKSAQGPGDVWRVSTPEAQGMRSKPLADLLRNISKKRRRIDSVTVVRNGALVLDAYFHPFRKGLKHPIYSVTKSITSALIGIALARGDLKSTNQPVLGFFPQKAPPEPDRRKSAMTLEHLLTMTAGFECRDAYRYKRVGLPALRNSPDWTRFALSLPMEDDPGTRFEYCNATSYLLTAILNKATGMRPLEYARTHLFGPIGIRDVTWPANPEGIQPGFSGLWLTAPDMARFGWLYLKRGLWNGRRVISGEWVDRSTKRQVDADIYPHYGYQWWGAGDGTYMALGYQGQRIFVLPAMNMVVVFTANLKPGQWRLPRNLLRRYILPAVASNDPLPANRKQQQRLERLTRQLARAPAEGWVWQSKPEGVALGDRFIRRAAPSFQLAFPPGSRKMTAKPGAQVIRLKTLSGELFSASVLGQPSNLTLAQAGPKLVPGFLRRRGTGFQVASNAPVMLKDGTRAYRTEIRWRSFQNNALTTVAVSVFKSGKWVLLLAHSWKKNQDVSWMTDTLSFGQPQ